MDHKIKLVLIFGIGGMIVSIINALTHLTTFGIVQIDTMVELFIQFPFLLIVFVQIYRSISADHDTLSPVAIIALNIFSYGYGIHLAANAINEYIWGDTRHRDILPSDVVEIINFFDEFMGHLVLFIGLFACFAILVTKELRFPATPEALDGVDKILIVILGSGFGVVLGLYLIEATYFIIPGIIWSVGFLTVVGRTLWRVDCRSHLYTVMLWFTHLSIPLIALIYYLIFGSLIPPSEIFGF